MLFEFVNKRVTTLQRMLQKLLASTLFAKCQRHCYFAARVAGGIFGLIVNTVYFSIYILIYCSDDGFTKTRKRKNTHEEKQRILHNQRCFSIQIHIEQADMRSKVQMEREFYKRGEILRSTYIIIINK